MSGNGLKAKQIYSGDVPYGYSLLSDGNGKTLFSKIQDTPPLTWKLDTLTSDANPTSGFFRRNNINLLNVTYLYFNYNGANNAEYDSILSNVISGDIIYIQDSQYSSLHEQYLVTGNIIDTTTYIKIPVTPLSSSITPITTNSTLCEFVLYQFGNRSGNKGTSFPTSPNIGDIFFRTDLNLLFQFDAVRSKWLSVDKQNYTCGRNVISGDVKGYFGTSDVLFSSTNGFVMPRNGTIVSATFMNTETITRDINITINNSETEKHILSLTNENSKTDLIIDLDFTQGDIIQVSANISTNNDILKSVVTLEIAWRE